MRSLSSSMSLMLSAIGLHIGEARGTASKRQRPEQAGLERGAQAVALQQKNKGRCRRRMQQDIAPVLRHRSSAPRDIDRPHHGGSLRVASSAGGFGAGRSWTLAAAPGFLASASVSTGCFGASDALDRGPPPFFSVVAPPKGAEDFRSTCGPGFGGLPDANPSSNLPKLSLVRSS